MDVAWGAVVVALSLLAWLGQVTSWLAPDRAESLGLTEAKEAVDPAFAADVRGEAIWDSLALWPMVVAGVLLAIGSESWAYFGLAGGAAYLYFAGRGLVTRHVLQSRGVRIGTRKNVAAGRVFLWIWGAMSAISLFLAVRDLGGL